MPNLLSFLAAGVAATVVSATVDVPIIHFPPRERSGTYIDIQVGTPPQTVSAIFDTGSSTLALGSSQTTGTNRICPANQPLPHAESADWSSENLNDESDVCVVGSYDPSSSSSEVDGAGSVECQTELPDGQCGFSVSYGTGAYGIEGHLVTDKLQMGGLSSRVSLGAITDMHGHWQQPPANGIFGVAMSQLNCLQPSLNDAYGQTCEPNAMTTFLEDNDLEDKFGLCLGSASEPGVLTLGGANRNFYTGKMHYTRITSNEGFYSVDFSAVGINGRELCSGAGCTTGTKQSSGPTIVDSGTPTLLLPEYAYRRMSEARDSCSTDSDCMVTLAIGDVCVSAAGLLSCQSGECRIIGESTAGATISSMGSVNGGSAIIGNAAINQLYLEFDRSGQRVGFATRSEHSCAVPCSSFLSVHSCQRAQCTWMGGSCQGGTGVGNSAAGSRVSSGKSCMSRSENAYIDTYNENYGNDTYYENDGDDYDDTGLAGQEPHSSKKSSSVTIIAVACVAAVAVAVVGAAYVWHSKRTMRRAESLNEKLLEINEA